MHLRNVAQCAEVPIELVADLPATALDELCERILQGDERVIGQS